jgi:hypothetical protein
MRICVNHTGEKNLWKFVHAVEKRLGAKVREFQKTHPLSAAADKGWGTRKIKNKAPA